MSAFVGKFRDFFSDLMLNIELIFTKKHEPEVVASNTPKASMAQQYKAAAEKKQALKSASLPGHLKRVRLSNKQRLAFYDEMATLVGSGVPLIDSLSLIQAQERNKSIKALYLEMIREINAGLSLADAMEMFPHVFPKMQSALVTAAEASGNLKEVLTELVEEMEASQDFLKKITGAMVYPLILLFLAISLVIGMMTFVIPKIAKMYDQSNVVLPGITQAVISISNFMVTSWPLLLGGIVAAVLLLYLFFVKLTFGKLLGEKIIAGIPVVGRLNKEKNIMMIASNMGMLMRSGVLITDAFAITKNTIGNLHYQQALEEIREGVVMGKEVSQMMGLEDIRTQKFREHKLFPLQMAQLIHIGESTGTIANMLIKIKKNYHKSIDYSLRNISTLVEPIMILIVAGLVGSILMAVMMPFFYIGNTIG